MDDDGQFFECAIYEHINGGGHCLYFGENEYEGMGEGQNRGTYSFKDGILRDSDGDEIKIKNVVEGQSEDYAPSTSTSSAESENDNEEFQPVSRGAGGRRQGRGRGRGSGGRGRGGRGRGGHTLTHTHTYIYIYI